MTSSLPIINKSSMMMTGKIDSTDSSSTFSSSSSNNNNNNNNNNNDPSGPDLTGLLVFSDIRLPIKESYVSKIRAGTEKRIFYFLCLLRNGIQVLQTQVVGATELIASPRGETCITFPNRMAIKDVDINFRVKIDVYMFEVDPAGSNSNGNGNSNGNSNSNHHSSQDSNNKNIKN